MSANQSKAKSVDPVVVLHEPKTEAGRIVMRLAPAGMASLLFHGLLFAGAFAWLTFSQTGQAQDVADAPKWEVVSAEPPEDEKKSFLVTDIDQFATESHTDINYPVDRIGAISVPGGVQPSEAAGIVDGNKTASPGNIPAPGGFGGAGQGGTLDTMLGIGNSNAPGLPGGYSPNGGALQGSFAGRSGQTRQWALTSGGGTTASEAAVAEGLKWIVRQQLSDGRWMLNSPNLAEKDRGTEANDVAATALGLLPLLAAGKTHKPATDNPYDKTVAKGLKFLMRNQNAKTGYFGVSMYAHGLATIAMCEAYGLSQDSALRRSAQAGINLIVSTQHETGGWRYGPSKQPGDLSISGWQIMALKSGQMAGLDVPQVSVRKATLFLDSCCNTASEGYGYVDGATVSPRMTAVGLLCRQYMQNWGPAHPRMIKAIGGIIKANPPDRQDVYYYYYATQVMHHFGGEAWKTWNDKMRDSLIKKQEKNPSSPNLGSWNPAGDQWGRAGGRLMMTSLNLLTLEVYYRYLPLYYRDAGYKTDSMVKMSP